MTRAKLTKDEIVETLKRSSIPTVLVEGKDDIHVYRKLIESLNDPVLSIIACGDRDVLFKVYEEVNELNNKKLVFIADKDSYIYIGIPDKYGDVIFTDGYCMENDIYDGCVIKEKLMSNKEIEDYNHLIYLVSEWYAFEVEKLKVGLEAKTSTHINLVIPDGSNVLCPEFLKSIDYTPVETELIDEIRNEYSKKLRGKQIFQCLARILTAKGRFAKYNQNILIDLALNLGNENLENLKAKIIEKIK